MKKIERIKGGQKAPFVYDVNITISMVQLSA